MTEDLAYAVEGSKLTEEIHRGNIHPKQGSGPYTAHRRRQNELQGESGPSPQDEDV